MLELRDRLPLRRAEYFAEIDQMMKCDLCYDRTSEGKKPMCATVCPSGAILYATLEEIERTRRGTPVNSWRFGAEEVRTMVRVIVPESTGEMRIGLAPDSAAVGSDDVATLLEEVGR